MSFDSSKQHIICPLSEKPSYKDSVFFPEYSNEPTRDVSKELPEGQVKVETRMKELERKLSGVPEMEVCTQEDGMGTPQPKVEWCPQEKSSLCNWAAEVVDAMEEALGVFNGGPKVKTVQDTATMRDSIDLAVKTGNSKTTDASDATHTLPMDEVALLHMSNTRRFSSFLTPSPSSSPTLIPKTEATVSHMNDGDSSDSDEEQLKAIHQRDLEDSEDQQVPIILSIGLDHDLRSLLKSPPRHTNSHKKSVSFYNDVTVYMFDQDIPTKELSKQSLTSVTKTQILVEGVHMSDDCSEEIMSEESTGVEWEVNIPSFAKPTKQQKSAMSPFDVTPSETPDSDLDFVEGSGYVWEDKLSLLTPNSSPALCTTASNAKTVLQFSRFTISPTSISRFSITPVSDVDLDSAGASGED